MCSFRMFRFGSFVWDLLFVESFVRDLSVALSSEKYRLDVVVSDVTL